MDKRIIHVIGIIVLIALLIYFFEQDRTGVPKGPELPAETAEKGDLVTITYVLMMENGSVIDTNNVELAQEFGLTTYPKGPYRFIIGQSGRVKGFDNAIIGMKADEHSIITIEPSESVAYMIINRTAVMSMFQPMPRYAIVTIKSYAEKFNKQPAIGDTAYDPEFPWAFKVANISEKRVALEHLVEPGKSYQLPGNPWNSTALVILARMINFRHRPVEGQTVETPIGIATVTLDRGRINLTLEPVIGAVLNRSLSAFGVYTLREFIVANYTDKEVKLRRINYPAQERLILDVTVLELTPTEKSS